MTRLRAPGLSRPRGSPRQIFEITFQDREILGVSDRYGTGQGRLPYRLLVTPQR